MSVNTAHASNGVLIHVGEYILLHSDNVYMDFSGQDNPVFKGSKQGRIYLTSHRMIFNNKKVGDHLQSFSAPFIAMKDVELEQPVFGANYIKGKVRAQPNGNFVGEVKFKLHFRAGGAIEYGMALLRAANTAQSNLRNDGYNDDPPPYTPSGNWYEAPPPAYQPPPGYYGWLPQHEAFSGPAPNTVFMTDNPPPYPGIGAPVPTYTAPSPPTFVPPMHPYNPTQPLAYSSPPPSEGSGPWNGFPMPATQQQRQAQQHVSQHSGPFQAQQQQQQQQQQQEMPEWNGFSLPPNEEGAYRPTHAREQQSSAARGSTDCGGGYQPYPSNQPGMVPPYPPYPPYPQQNAPPAYDMGFFGPPHHNKEAEALAAAYNNTENQRFYRPHRNDALPPAYEDLSRSYAESKGKKE
uniref:GRAM domain-containing protein n=1 Tax=Glossina austeni TaxID=7395 RepID=A0A1A9UFU1_GLOAU